MKQPPELKHPKVKIVSLAAGRCCWAGAPWGGGPAGGAIGPEGHTGLKALGATGRRAIGPQEPQDR